MSFCTNLDRYKLGVVVAVVFRTSQFKQLCIVYQMPGVKSLEIVFRPFTNFSKKKFK